MRNSGVYGVVVVFDDVDYWKFLESGYVEVFVDLVLVGSVVVEIG